jgi:hypothetical protein
MLHIKAICINNLAVLLRIAHTFGFVFMSRHEKLDGQDGVRCGARILL